MSAILIETREFLGKTLIYQFIVKEIGYKIGNKEYFSNKWLRFEDWLEIYAVLDKILLDYENSVKNILSKVDKYTTSAGAEIKIIQSQISNSLKNFIGNDKTYLNTGFIITIGKLNIIELLDKVNSFEKTSGRQTELRTSIATKMEVLSDIHDEYNPSTSDNVESSSIKYKPSAVGETKVPDPSKSCEDDPYSPKPVETTETVPEVDECPKDPSPIYQPSKITRSKCAAAFKMELDNNSNESKPSESEVINKPDVKQMENTAKSSRKMGRKCNTPLPYDDDQKTEFNELKSGNEAGIFRSSVKDKQKLIFGSDDSGEEEEWVPKRKKVNSKKQPKNDIKASSSKVSIRKIESALAGMLTTEFPKHDKSVRTELIQKPSVVKHKIKNITTTQRIAEVNELRRQRITLEAQNEMLKALIKPRKPPAKIDILTLKHLTLNVMSNTYEDFKDLLDDIFKKKKVGPIRKGFYGMNHLVVQDLVEVEQYRRLLDILSHHYEPDKSIIPQFTDLYMSVMVPEWILLLFMKEYNFTKKEALKRIFDQEDLMTYGESD